jgi:hypothetical protein
MEKKKRATPLALKIGLVVTLVVLVVIGVLILLAPYIVPKFGMVIGNVEDNAYTFTVVANKSDGYGTESYYDEIEVRRCQAFLFFDGCHKSSLIKGFVGSDSDFSISLEANILTLKYKGKDAWRCSASAKPLDTVQNYEQHYTGRNTAAETLNISPPPAC